MDEDRRVKAAQLLDEKNDEEQKCEAYLVASSMKSILNVFEMKGNVLDALKLHSITCTVFFLHIN